MLFEIIFIDAAYRTTTKATSHPLLPARAVRSHNAKKSTVFCGVSDSENMPHALLGATCSTTHADPPLLPELPPPVSPSLSLVKAEETPRGVCWTRASTLARWPVTTTFAHLARLRASSHQRVFTSGSDNGDATQVRSAHTLTSFIAKTKSSSSAKSRKPQDACACIIPR